jgi:hypothetical protein
MKLAGIILAVIGGALGMFDLIMLEYVTPDSMETGEAWFWFDALLILVGTMFVLDPTL